MAIRWEDAAKAKIGNWTLKIEIQSGYSESGNWINWYIIEHELSGGFELNKNFDINAIHRKVLEDLDHTIKSKLALYKMLNADMEATNVL